MCTYICHPASEYVIVLTQILVHRTARTCDTSFSHPTLIACIIKLSTENTSTAAVKHSYMLKLRLAFLFFPQMQHKAVTGLYLGMLMHFLRYCNSIDSTYQYQVFQCTAKQKRGFGPLHARPCEGLVRRVDISAVEHA